MCFFYNTFADIRVKRHLLSFFQSENSQFLFLQSIRQIAVLQPNLNLEIGTYVLFSKKEQKNHLAKYVTSFRQFNKLTVSFKFYEWFQTKSGSFIAIDLKNRLQCSQLQLGISRNHFIYNRMISYQAFSLPLKFTCDLSIFRSWLQYHQK